MVEYYALRVEDRGGGNRIYLKLEKNRLTIEAEDGGGFDSSTLVNITKKELEEALKKIK